MIIAPSTGFTFSLFTSPGMLKANATPTPKSRAATVNADHLIIDFFDFSEEFLISSRFFAFLISSLLLKN
jgi:hypothetical protein